VTRVTPAAAWHALSSRSRARAYGDEVRAASAERHSGEAAFAIAVMTALVISIHRRPGDIGQAEEATFDSVPQAHLRYPASPRRRTTA